MFVRYRCVSFTTLTLTSQARIALSPEEAFSGDGKGPVTKVRFNEDAEEMLEGLMRIWDEPGGHRIREKWSENIFPSTLGTRGPGGVAGKSGPATGPLVRRRGQGAAEMVARNREAQGARSAAAQPTLPNQEGDSYHRASRRFIPIPPFS
jgi:hypothetical protein